MVPIIDWALVVREWLLGLSSRRIMAGEPVGRR